LVTFALKFEDKIIATLLCRVDAARVNALGTAYDPSFSVYAPGKILWGECLRWLRSPPLKPLLRRYLAARAALGRGAAGVFRTLASV